MQLLTLFALLCSMGPVLSAGARRHPCSQPILEATGMCNDGKAPTKRFGYNSNYKICEQFYTTRCRGRNGNNFPNLRACLEKCNSTSRCLKTPPTGTGRGSVTSFVFNVNTMKCISTKFPRETTDPQINLFKNKQDCENECKPILIQDLYG
uniref:Putative tick kunitz 1 n=1 Tax=Amblyomma cajennense TaxID=34607 RepID=A0A023FRD3_AMBCJ